jgi:streptogramin lyase
MSCAGQQRPLPVMRTQQPAHTLIRSPQTSGPSATARDLHRIPLTVPPGSGYAVAIDNGRLWLVIRDDHSLSAIDLTSKQLAAPTLQLPIAPASIATGEGGIWIVDAEHRRVIRLDPATQQIVAELDISAAPFPEYEHLWIAVGEGYVWLVGQRHVLRIDPRTNQVLGQPIAIGEEVIAYGVGAGSFWTGSHDDGILARIEPATGEVTARIDVGFSIHGLAVLDDAAWVLDEHGFGVVRVDAATNRPGIRVPIDFVASNLAAGNGSVWIAAAAQNNGPTGMDWIARLDTATHQVAEKIHVGGAFESDYFVALYLDGAPWALVSTPEPYVVRLVE